MNLRLIRIKNLKHHHVSMDVVDDFESSIQEQDGLKVYYESKYLRKFIRPYIANLINKVSPKYRPPVLCISMGATGVNRSFPHMFFSSGNILYLFDAWPGTYELIEKIVSAYNVRILFVSSKVSRDNLSVLLPGTEVRWCPEGCKVEIYKPLDYSLKDIDVVQIGRKYDLWHDKVVDELAGLNISYLYEKIKGKSAFKGRENFLSGLGRSRISVCFPKSVTHPAESGGLDIMSNRYLQSMASKCLILGAMPEEMKELFSYDPVVPANMNDPVGQIEEILRNYDDFEPLIEKNYNECIANHTWKNRWQLISSIIKTESPWNKEVSG